MPRTLRGFRYRLARKLASLDNPRSGSIEIEKLATPRRGAFEPKAIEFGRLRIEGRALLSSCSVSEPLHLPGIPPTLDCLPQIRPRVGAVEPSAFMFLTLQAEGLPLLTEPLSREQLAPLVEPRTADCLDLFEEAPSVSENLFWPLGQPRPGGKRYGKAETFLFDCSSADPTRSAYRKSYRETKDADGTKTRWEMTIWDLLLPLLQPPPFDLATCEAVFLPVDLQPHQPSGVNFLASRTGALLGDGVQTGKTIQAIVAMKILFHTGRIRSALVICPISVLLHWQNQLEKWAPELWQGLTIVRSASKEQRRTMWRMRAHVHVTNYETVVSDFDDILAHREENGIGLIVCDEIQRIKNPATATAQSVKQLGEQAAYRWGLSATPVENSLEDLVSIYEFLVPGLLRRNEELELTAKQKIKPYFLRRRTQDICRDFIEPRYDEYRVDMEGRQLEAYQEAFERSVAELRQLGERVTVAHAFAKLQALKQLCNVYLPMEKSAESAKLDWLLDWLEDIVASGSKVLVFSQYDEFGLDFLARRLQQEKYGCVHYGLARNDRAKNSAVRSFCQDPGIGVFLANPKTAGTGMPDLKVANYVVHFDHWWNPATVDQADGRILGIGQKKDAFISHLWVANSIEGRIEQILQQKRALFGRVIDAQTERQSGLTAEELFGIFGLQPPPLRSKPRIPGSEEQNVENLDPIEFEHLVARLYKAMGYSSRVTPPSRDRGIDVIAIRDLIAGREKLAVQCKHQRSPVGRPELQNLLGAIADDPSYSACVVVTSSTFSGDAREYCSRIGRLTLVDGLTLHQLLVKYKVPVREA